MFKFFRKRSNGQAKSRDTQPKMQDMNGADLQVGDIVEVLRYDLGLCKVIDGEKGWEYESLETGERVHYSRMVDAATSFQKVRKSREAGK
ncbi:MAG: hypothetical protein AAFR61_25530 [Bacteroidota bacterium]